MQFKPDRRPSKWGATAALAPGSTLEEALEYLSTPGKHPFDDVTRLSAITEIKGYRYCMLQVSLDFGHPSFPAAAPILEEAGGSEFYLDLVQAPGLGVYLIIDKRNLPEEEARPDHPLLVQLAEWLGPAMARR